MLCLSSSGGEPSEDITNLDTDQAEESLEWRGMRDRTRGIELEYGYYDILRNDWDGDSGNTLGLWKGGGLKKKEHSARRGNH